MIKISVSDAQQASSAIKKALSDLSTDKSVLVGIHETAGNTPDNDMTMAELGATLHFGTDSAGKNHDVSIPARNWLDVGVLSGTKDYVKIIEDNPDDLDHAMEIIGLVAVSKCQEYMTDLNEPPNAQSTIAKKGSSNPLIDTGALRNSVTYSVTNALPEEGI